MKKVISIFALLFPLLAGCGFVPMYSESHVLKAELADIYIAPIAGTNGIDLRNHLILNWNTSNIEGAKYTLHVDLREPQTFLKGLQRTGDATWEEVRVTATWRLSRDGETVAQSTETAAESYTFVADLVAAAASRANATRNAIRVIGNRITMKVNAKLKSSY